MKKIDYNLASGRKISPRAFALRAGLLLLVSLLLGGLTVANLVRLRERNRIEKSASGLLASRLDEMNRLGARYQQEIAAGRNLWKNELAAANRLIERKSFSFVARLDFLEKTFSPGIRIRQLSLVNEAAGTMTMTISAQSLKELFALYRKLAPYDLAISSETQSQDEYQVNLLCRISNEKI
jgi:hypothetical protein